MGRREQKEWESDVGVLEGLGEEAALGVWLQLQKLAYLLRCGHDAHTRDARDERTPANRRNCDGRSSQDLGCALGTILRECWLQNQKRLRRSICRNSFLPDLVGGIGASLGSLRDYVLP